MLESTRLLVVVQALTFLDREEATALGVSLFMVRKIRYMVSGADGYTTASSDVIQADICDWNKVVRWKAILEMPRSMFTIGEVEATAIVVLRFLENDGIKVN